ncbi:MAG: MFS transporter [Halobacteriales archaeon]
MEPPVPDREWAVAAVLSTAHSAQHFYSSLLAPLIPILTVALSLPLWQLGALASLYSFVSGFGQAPMGVLADRHDRRLLLAPGIGVMGLGYVLFGLAPAAGAHLPTVTLPGATLRGPFLVMAAGIAVTGAGSSVVHPTGYPLISANVSAHRKGRALGVWGSASKFGDTLAPAAVAVLILVLSWDRIVLALGAVGVGYAAVLALVLGREAIDTRPPESGDGSDDGADGGSGGSASDVLADRRAFVYPMIAVLLFFVTRGVATKGVKTFVPAFVTDAYGYSLSAFGVTVGPESLANVYFSALLLTAAAIQLVAGGLTDRYDHRKVIVGMFGLATLGLAALSFVRLGPLALLAALAVVGGSIWGANPARDALVSDISPAEWEGRTFGSLWTVTQALSAASPAIVGYVADLTTIQNSFRYLALATLLAGASAALLLSPRVYVSPGAEPESR